MKLTTWMCGALLVVAAAGCKKADKAEESKSSGKTETKETEKKEPEKKQPEEQKQTGSGSGTAATPGTQLTGEEMAKKYGECWGFFNDRNWDGFKGCFDANAESEQVDWGQPITKGNQAIADDAKSFTVGIPDAKGEVQLTLVGDNHVVGIVLITGTNSAPMPTPDGKEIPATNKKIGLLIGHVIDIDPKTGLATGEWAFIDQSAFLGQLGVAPTPHREPMTEGIAEKGTVVVGANTDAEKANLAMAQQGIQLFNEHKLDEWIAQRSDDYTFTDQSIPKDINRTELKESLGGAWKTFSDMKIEVAGEFAAGDYVVTVGQLTGTNDGDIMGQKATGKPVKVKVLTISHIKDGKFDKGWRFWNSLAFPMQLGLMK